MDLQMTRGECAFRLWALIRKIEAVSAARAARGRKKWIFISGRGGDARTPHKGLEELARDGDSTIKKIPASLLLKKLNDFCIFYKNYPHRKVIVICTASFPPVILALEYPQYPP